MPKGPLDTIANIAGRGVGMLGALASIRGGGLVNYMMARERMLADPAQRAGLINSPFTSGFFGLSQTGETPGPVAAPGDQMPATGGVTAPQDMRYLPPGGRSYPDVAPLDYETAAKQEQDRANMIGLTSSDPLIRGQSKSALGLPVTGAELFGPQGMIAQGRQIVTQAGPGSQVQYKTGFGGITVGSPYIAGEYLSYDAAVARANVTGGQVVPSSTGSGFQVVQPQQTAEHEYMTEALANSARQPDEKTVPSGRLVNGQPTWVNIKQQPAGGPALPTGPAKPTAPAAAPTAAPATPPARRPPPAPAPTATAPPPSPPPPPPPEQEAPTAAPSPAPQAAPPPPPPQPPPQPPHEVVIMRPDGSFAPAPKPAPAPAPRPRAEAAPVIAPPMLAAGAPSLFQFPGQAGGAPEAAPVMVASAAPPPYQLVPGSELGGVASGAPPAPAEQRGAPPSPAAPAPAAAVPWQQPTAGQPSAGVTQPAGMPTATQSFTETQPISAAEGGGTKTFSGTTEYGLDVERRRKEIDAEIQRRFGNVPDPDKLRSAYQARVAVNALLNEYTPKQRAAYVGWFTPYIQRFESTPRYEHFLALNGEIASYLAQAGTPDKFLNDLPTGMEHTPNAYESALRSAADRSDGMITGLGVLANAHPGDLTPAKQQKIISGYMDRATDVIHYGPYPWNTDTSEAVSTQTPTSPQGPTTTTLYPVDVRRTVQPSR